MDSVNRQRYIFLFSLLLFITAGVFFISKSLVSVDQYNCYFINYRNINMSERNIYGNSYDVVCQSKDNIETLCYACVHMSGGVFVKTQIEQYIPSNQSGYTG